jgi:hypothetical protein
MYASGQFPYCPYKDYYVAYIGTNLGVFHLCIYA